MLKLMLIDDEPLMLERLSRMLNWQDCGFELCGCAINGQQGLSMAEAFQPDVIITDIEMPVMDGLAFLHELRMRGYSRTRVVILTAYEDFLYAKRALEDHAARYILKDELSSEALRTLLSELKASIIQEQSQGRQHLLQSLLAGMRPQESINASLSSAAQPFLLVIRARQPLSLAHISCQKPREILIDEQRLMTSLRSEQNALHLLEMVGIQGGIWSVLFLSQTHSRMQLHEEVYRLARHIRSHFLSHHQTDVTLLITPTGHQIGHIQQDIKQLTALSANDAFLIQPLTWAQDIDSAFCSEPIVSLDAPLAALRAAILEGHADALSSALEALHQLFLPPFQSLKRFQTVFEHTHLLMLQLSQTVSHSFPQPGHTLYTACDAWAWLAAQAPALLAACQNKGTYSPRIAAAIAYIDANYHQKLTAQRVAASVELSEAYFASLFKRETGQTFLEYLSQRRLCAAKTLLRTTTMKIYEIAELTGYQSPRYFATAFLHLTGRTPNAYRNGGDSLEDED